MKHSQLGSERFERFSNWKILLRAIACLTRIAQTYKKELAKDAGNRKGWNHLPKPYSVSEFSQAKNIICAVQQEAFSEEFRCIEDNRNILKNSLLFKLNPLTDENGLMRVECLRQTLNLSAIASLCHNDITSRP